MPRQPLGSRERQKGAAACSETEIENKNNKNKNGRRGSTAAAALAVDITNDTRADRKESHAPSRERQSELSSAGQVQCNRLLLLLLLLVLPQLLSSSSSSVSQSVRCLRLFSPQLAELSRVRELLMLMMLASKLNTVQVGGWKISNFGK